MGQYKKSNPGSSDVELVEFDNAKNIYFNEKYAQAVQALLAFMQEYPASPGTNEARYYLAESYRQTNDPANATYVEALAGWFQTESEHDQEPSLQTVVNLLADYKTDRPAPSSLDAVAPGYIRQLALYRALLQRIYPGRKVRAALVFTEVPRLIDIPQSTLDAEIARLTHA